MNRCMRMGILVSTMCWLLATVAGAAEPAASSTGGKTSAASAKSKHTVGMLSPAQRQQLQEQFRVPAVTAAAGIPLTGAVAVESKQLTIEELATMLENMGYEVKTSTYDTGKEIYATLTRGTWTFYITFKISPDQSNIWMLMFLGTVKNPEKASVDALLNLLQSQDSIWPTYASFSMQHKNLWLKRPLPNAGVTPVVLRKTLESFMTNTEISSAFWYPLVKPPEEAAASN